MTRDQIFQRIIEEKVVIDPLIWLLKIQFEKVYQDHDQYVRAMMERHKNNSKVMKQLQPYIELGEIE